MEVQYIKVLTDELEMPQNNTRLNDTISYTYVE